MLKEYGTTTQRTDAARAARETLPDGGHDAAVMHVQCARSHHLAVVFDTPDGLVYQSTIRPRSHGSKDRVDEMHGAAVPEQFVDFLDAGVGADDALPAWCDCGPRTLSRVAVESWVAAHEHRVVVD